MEIAVTYISQDRSHALASGDSLPERSSGAALFADISGFTPLTEAFTRRLGPQRGAEELTRQLNRVYDSLIADVERFGGSVIGFSGDAITCWFDSTSAEFSVSSSELRAGRDPNSELRTQNSTHLRAVACALAMQRTMGRLDSVPLPGGDVAPLAMKVAVASGEARRLVVGDPAIQLIDVLAGRTIERLAASEQQARSGEVVLDEETVAALGSCVRIRERRGGAAVVAALLDEPEPRPWAALQPGALDEETVRQWVLPAIYQRLVSGSDAYLAELRPVAVLFLRFGELDYDNDPRAAARLDGYVRWVQHVLARYDGALIQLTTGDKGSYLYASFGAPIAHGDDAARAVAAALELRSPPVEVRATAHAGEVQIGLSMGAMRTGAYGGVTRSTYGVLGDEVNLAARLMQRAAPGQIVASQRVMEAARRRFPFRPLGALQVKGRREPIPVFEVLDRRTSPGSAAATEAEDEEGRIVGRSAERECLSERIQQLWIGQAPGPVIVEGEAGIGKSLLVEDALEQARALGIRTLLGAGDPIEKATPYHTWRPVFQQLFGLDDLPESAEVRREHVLARIEDDPELMRLAPLLNTLLPLDIPENELTERMSGQVRADNTAELLIGLLRRAAEADPLLLTIEDAHWMDSASWALTLRAVRDVHPALAVIATRPPGDPAPAAYLQLVEAPEAICFRLAPLGPDEIEKLVCQRLGVGELPEEVGALIRGRAEGHPFFSEELAYALRDSGIILIQEVGGRRRCRVAPQVNIGTVTVPDTVQSVVTSRIDRLEPGQQLTLKVASVVGRVFPFRVVQHVHPVAIPPTILRSQMATFQQLDLTLLDSPEPDLAYLFKHAITQEAAYNLMLYAQRRELHERVARWYEQAFADDLSPYYPLLVHHWRQAESPAKTVEYLEKAGAQALQRGAYQEARDSFAELLEVAGAAEADDPAQVRRRAYWRSGLAQAYQYLGQMIESRRYAEEAVAVLDRPVPASGRQAASAVLREALRQARYRLAPARVRAPLPSEKAREDAIEASRLYRVLNTVYYFANESALNMYISLRRLNAVEPAGPSGELVEAYGTMGFLCSAVGLYGLAERYYARYLAADRTVNDPLALAFALNASSLARTVIGQWPKIREEIGRAMEIAERFGDWHRLGESLATLATAEHHAGAYARSDELAGRLRSHALEHENSLQQIWALYFKAINAMRQGRLQDALTAVGQNNRLLGGNASRLTELGALGVLAQIYLMLGDRGQARAAADAALRMIAPAPVPSAQSAYEGYVGPAYVYMALWEQAAQQGAPEEAQLRQAARQACRFVGTYALLFPVGRPARNLLNGSRLWLEGRQKAARSAWHKARAAAKRYGMPYEEGRACFELGRHAAGEDRARHLAEAAAIFERIGAPHELAYVREHMEGK